MAYHPRQSLGPRKQTAIPSSSQPQPSSQQSKGVGYPILKAWDIVDIFHSLGIMIQEEDINKPTAQAIQGVWKMLLEETSGVTLEGFERPKGALLGMMQYPVSSREGGEEGKEREGREKEGKEGEEERRACP